MEIDFSYDCTFVYKTFKTDSSNKINFYLALAGVFLYTVLC